MKALVHEGRICEVVAQEFPVAPPMAWVDCADDVTPMTHQYVDGQIVVIPVPEPQPPAVPTIVTMRQARLALLQVGLLDSVNAAVAAADEATKITWEFSSTVERNHPFVATLTAALNLTSQQLDDLFTLAATL